MPLKLRDQTTPYESTAAADGTALQLLNMTAVNTILPLPAVMGCAKALCNLNPLAGR
jgi:hypothetical protein